MSDLALLVAGAIGIAVVSLADTISTSSAFAARTGQEVNGNGEMIGIGAANVGAGLFQGFPVSTSGPRTALAAVVIAASLSLADVPGTVRLWHQRRTEFLLSVAAFLGVALLGVLPGIAV